MFVDSVGWLNSCLDFGPLCCAGNLELGFKQDEKAYGGSLMKRRKGRGIRPLAVKNSMHLVLRSSLAKGEWSLLRHSSKIRKILKRFSTKYGVKILAVGNAGNHVHLHIQLSNRFTYKPFIRATTASIAMAITGMSRWKKLDIKFWDRRPFTRIVIGRRAFLRLADYVFMNGMEGQGHARDFSRLVVEEFRRRESTA